MGAHTCILTWPEIEKQKKLCFTFFLSAVAQKKVFSRGGVYSGESEKGGRRRDERKKERILKLHASLVTGTLLS